MKMKRIQKVCAAALVSVMVVACGGGDKSGPEPVPEHSFTHVDNYPITDCVKDTSTGLIWEGKPPSGFRSGSTGYTNYDSLTEPQRGYSTYFVTPAQSDLDLATNAIGYKNAVNASALCGFTNWRLPTLDELKGLVVLGSAPTIDRSWFPNSYASFYWSSSAPFKDPKNGLGVNFHNGNYGTNSRDYKLLVRLVRP